MEYLTILIKPSVRVFSCQAECHTEPVEVQVEVKGKSIENKVINQNSILDTIPIPIAIGTIGITRIDKFSLLSLAELCKSLLKEADELVRIFISSRKTGTLNLNN